MNEAGRSREDDVLLTCAAAGRSVQFSLDDPGRGEAVGTMWMP